ncbi:unnamed protein product [Adineta steineri]|uniref:GH16 domain-containing protein n=1 Tax=Adineta steineri TaxID=433720 RepID=A0A815I8B7_9BILA|nr:unnamed protein product [Adineta steineri]CAF1364931.1 unnamed protein product [Adineta steineri]
MDNHRLRAMILKLQDRLSNDDRKRLHFYLGNDVPRRIRDDPTLGGTLSLMDSLFDQDKVNEKDFTFLINAFDEIQCIDAVKLLREHWRHNQSDAHNQSVESLSMILPPVINQLFEDLDEDKYSMQQLLVNQKNTCGNNNIMINSNNTNINQIPIMNCDEKPQHPEFKKKQLLKSRKILWKCLLLFVLLLIIGYGILAFFSIRNFADIRQLKTSNNQSNKTIQQLKDKVEQLEKLMPTCTDGVKNQDESDVDCGGAICSKKCLPQQGCTSSSDCARKNCDTKSKKCLNHTFEDEFNQDGGVDMSKWKFDVGGNGWGNEEEQYYTDNYRKNAWCENGQLIIEARKENYKNKRFTSARLISKQAFLYGRLQIPENRTYGNTMWPDNGAIYLMAHLGHDWTTVTAGTATKSNNHQWHAVEVSNATIEYMIYTLQWEPDKMEMFVGSNEKQALLTRIFVWEKSNTDWTQWPFDKPFRIHMNLAIGGTAVGKHGIDEGAFPQRMEIDWVRFDEQ